jgi:hypothetical protein
MMNFRDPPVIVKLSLPGLICILRFFGLLGLMETTSKVVAGVEAETDWGCVGAGT